MKDQERIEKNSCPISWDSDCHVIEFPFNIEKFLHKLPKWLLRFLDFKYFIAYDESNGIDQGCKISGYFKDGRLYITDVKYY